MLEMEEAWVPLPSARPRLQRPGDRGRLAAPAHSKDRQTRRQPWSPSSSSPRPALGVGVGGLTLSTSECGCLWRLGLLRGD